LSEPPVYAPLGKTSFFFLKSKNFSSTYIARILTAKANPIKSGASPVFDFVSSATIRITVTSTNVTTASVKIPFTKKKNQSPMKILFIHF
jgi:hypothetical protein